MSIDQGLALIGIVVGVLAFLVAKKVINRNRSQRQSVGKGGMGIQSGRDTKIDK